MTFTPTYADYVNSLGRDPDMTEAQWSALSDQDKWAVSAGVAQIRANDPRYADLHALTGGQDGRNLYVTDSTRQHFHGGLTSPEYQGQGFFAHSEDQQSPALQAYGHKQFDPNLLLAAAWPFMAAGATSLLGGEGLLGDAASSFGPGAFDSDGFSAALSGSEGANAFGPGAFDGDGFSAALSGTEGGNPFGPGAFDSMDGAASATNYAPVSEASTTAGGAPVTDLSVHAGLGDTVRNLVPGGLLNSLGGASGLLRVAGLGLSAYGLLNGNHNSNSNSNSNNSNNPGDKGGNGQGLNITRGQYTPNPITQAQLQNFRYAQPRGR